MLTLLLSIQKQPSCEKSVQPQKARVKKDVKSKSDSKETAVMVGRLMVI